MDKMVKFYRAEIKEVNEEKKTVLAKISDQTLDRHGDIILASAWAEGLKEFKKHPVLLSSHNYSGLTNQIGKVKRIWVDEEEKGLMAEMEYYAGEGNLESDWAYNLAKKNMAAYSVGFMVHDYISAYSLDKEGLKEVLDRHGITLKKDQRLNHIFTKVSLLENSHVTIPANPSALQRSFDIEKDEIVKELIGEIQEMKDLEVVSYVETFDYIEGLLKECAGECDTKVAVPFKAYPVNEKSESWSGSDAKARMQKWSSEDESEDNNAIDLAKYKKGFLVVEGDTDNVTSYKYPHHDVKDGNLVTHWRGVVAAMARLKNVSDESERKSAYDHLVKHYEQFEAEAPEYKEYKTVEDVISGCKDVTTASVLLDSIHEEKTADILEDVLTHLSIENKLDEKVEDLVNKVVEKISTTVLEKVEKIIKSELDINADVIINTLGSVEKKKDNVKNDSETYVAEIFDINSFLRKPSV